MYLDPVSNPKRTADEHADIMCPSAIPFVLVHLACLGHSGPGSRGTLSQSAVLYWLRICDRRRIPSILLALLPPSLNGFALRRDDCQREARKAEPHFGCDGKSCAGPRVGAKPVRESSTPRKPMIRLA